MEILKADKLDNIIRELTFKDKDAVEYEDPELHKLSMYDGILYQLESKELKIKDAFTEEELFYSRYYWFKQFIKRYTKLYGPNGSLDEQRIQMWENYYLSHSNIDWKLLEQIENGSI
jgi:hypothetical protein